MSAPQQLRWHRDEEVATLVRAWATKLNPEDRLPPYYRITKVAKNQTSRRIDLVRPRASNDGHGVIEVGVGDNLKDAKQRAQEDYERRIRAHHRPE